MKSLKYITFFVLNISSLEKTRSAMQYCKIIIESDYEGNLRYGGTWNIVVIQMKNINIKQS